MRNFKVVGKDEKKKDDLFGSSPDSSKSKPVETKVIETKPVEPFVKKEVVKEVEPPQMPKKYMVEQSARFVSKGAICIMRKGKIVKEGQYDIAELKKQGILLKEV